MKPTTAIACAVGLLGAFYLARWDAERTGYAKGLLAVGAARVDTLTRVVRQVDTAYIRDTVRLRYTRTQYDSIRLTDTVSLVVERPGKPDTVRVFIPRDVADTAIAACFQVVRSCESRVAARDSLIYALRGQISLAEKSRLSKLSRILNNALWLGAGYGLGKVTGR